MPRPDSDAGSFWQAPKLGDPVRIKVLEVAIGEYAVVFVYRHIGNARHNLIGRDQIEKLGVGALRADDCGDENAGVQHDPDHLARGLVVLWARLAAATVALISRMDSLSRPLALASRRNSATVAANSRSTCLRVFRGLVTMARSMENLRGN